MTASVSQKDINSSFPLNRQSETGFKLPFNKRDIKLFAKIQFSNYVCMNKFSLDAHVVA